MIRSIVEMIAKDSRKLCVEYSEELKLYEITIQDSEGTSMFMVGRHDFPEALSTIYAYAKDPKTFTDNFIAECGGIDNIETIEEIMEL